jgi:Hypothetical protein (DUF2513)
MILAIEDAPSGYAPDEIVIEGYTPDQISYHAYLLLDARLADGYQETTTDSTGPEGKLISLTWAGHEFADAARDETRWRKAMGVVQEKGGSVIFPFSQNC